MSAICFRALTIQSRTSVLSQDATFARTSEINSFLSCFSTTLPAFSSLKLSPSQYVCDPHSDETLSGLSPKSSLRYVVRRRKEHFSCERAVRHKSLAARVTREEVAVACSQPVEPSHVGIGIADFSNGRSGQGHTTQSSLSLDPPTATSASAGTGFGTEEEERQAIDRLINACILGAAGVYAFAKVFTVDHDYWHGWTVFEILKYAPIHNWAAYEEALQNHPVLAKMMISGIVYSIGDWMAQCYEGKPLLEFSRARTLRSGLVGFCLHGSLSHFYYHFCEAIFPFKDWWVVPLKVAFDQTIWSGFWNSVYYVTLGLLRLESPITILSEWRATFFPLLTAGWKLWPFAHLITYSVIPVEQRLLWVDCVELVWVTILSMYSNEKSEARNLKAVAENTTNSLSETDNQMMDSSHNFDK